MPQQPLSEAAALAREEHLARLARWARPMRAGPQPWNQIGATCDEQLARAREPPPTAEQAERERMEEIVREVMAAELPAALAKGRRTA